MSQNRQKLILNWIVKRLIFSKLRKRIWGSECRGFEPHIPPKIVTRKNKRGANFRSSFHLQSFLWSIVGEGVFSYDASKKGSIANPPCIGGYKEKGSNPNCNEPQKLNKNFWGSLQKDSFLIRIASRWRYRSYRYARWGGVRRGGTCEPLPGPPLKGREYCRCLATRRSFLLPCKWCAL